MVGTSATGEVVVDVDEMRIFISVHEELKVFHEDQQKNESGTIFKVPDYIRESHPEAFCPNIVTIGPYHKKSANPFMEHLKRKFLNDLLSRHPENQLEKCISLLSDAAFLTRAIDCYSDPPDCCDDKDSFVKLMLFDGCFIVEFLIKYITRGDMGEFLNFNREVVRGDLLKLENQMPFFVLQTLFSCFKDSSSIKALKGGELTMTYLAAFTFSSCGDNNHNLYNCRLGDISDYAHLLHLVQLHHRPTLQSDFPPRIIMHRWLVYLQNSLSYILKGLQKSLSYILKLLQESFSFVFWMVMFLFVYRPSDMSVSVGPSYLSIPSAKVLQQSGIKLERKEWGYTFEGENTSSLLDVTFNERNGVMQLPLLPMNDFMIFRLRNLVAFEQYSHFRDKHVTAYIGLMDCLIDTSDDVALLHKNRILEGYMGKDAEVASFFNDFGRVARQDTCHYLSGLLIDVNKYCSHKRHGWRASMMNDYFKNPWSTISVIAAVILLLLTLAQTTFAVLAYFRPP